MTDQMVIALHCQIHSFIHRIESGDADAGQEMAAVLDKIPPGIADSVVDLIDQATKADLALQQAVETRQQQEAVRSAQSGSPKLMTVAKAAHVLERKFHRYCAAAAICGVYKAARERDQKGLEKILEALHGIKTYGSLQATLDAIAEKVSAILLEMKVRWTMEANTLFFERRQATGLHRDGLNNRAHRALRSARDVYFAVPGLAAIQRMIVEDRLPSIVYEYISPDSVDFIRDRPKPATLLLKILHPKRREVSFD